MRKGEQTRGAIVRAAQKRFAKDGVHRVGVPDVAGALALSNSAVYRHFADKDEILLACIVAAVEETRAFVDARVPVDAAADARLEAFVRVNLEWIEELPVVAHSLLSMQYFAATSAPLRSLYKEIYLGSIARIATYIRQGARERIWKAGDPEECARAIHDLMTGESIKMFHAPKELSLSRRAELCWRSARKLIG